MYSRSETKKSIESSSIEGLRSALETVDAILIGAGAGLSSSAGLTYSGKRFERYFSDFYQKYGISDMYSGGFYPFGTLEEYWAWWSRHIFYNRYVDAPIPVYRELLSLVEGKDYFVLTTNVDHCFQQAGFDRQRLFYTQGDYGLFQCSKPCHPGTYDNGDTVRQMVLSQGFAMAPDGELLPPGNARPKMTVPHALLPRCPVCGRPMSMNLRSDDTFVEDAGWHAAASRYTAFLRDHREKRTVFLDLGTGWNTPGIVKFPFWRMTEEWPDATYVCLNRGEACAPEELRARSICIDGDIGDTLQRLSGNF